MSTRVISTIPTSTIPSAVSVDTVPTVSSVSTIPTVSTVPTMRSTIVPVTADNVVRLPLSGTAVTAVAANRPPSPILTVRGRTIPPVPATVPATVTNPAVLTPGALVPVLPTAAIARPPSPVVITTPVASAIPVATVSTRPPSPRTAVIVTRPPTPPVVRAPVVASGAPAAAPALAPIPAMNTLIVPSAPLPSPTLLRTPVSPIRTAAIPSQAFAGVMSLPASPVKVPTIMGEQITAEDIEEIEEGEKTEASRSSLPTYQSLITAIGLEGELLNARYQIEGTITLSNERNERRVQYIKAINANGQRVYIIVDVNGVLAPQRNLTMVALNAPTRVHHSTKSGAYDCVKDAVSGVAFEIGVDGLSTIIRDRETLEPVEINYAVVSRDINMETDNAGTVMTYPIIRMSEIRADAPQVLQNTDIAFNCLRTTTLVSHKDAILEATESIKNMTEAWVSFNTVRYDVANALADDIRQLSHWSAIFNARTIVTDTDRDKVNSIQRNLAIRHERLEDILRLTRKVINRVTQIEVITAEINTITQLIENNNRDLGTIL